MAGLGGPPHKLSLGSSCAPGGREGLGVVGRGTVLQEQALSALLSIHIPSEQSRVSGGFKEIDIFHIRDQISRLVVSDSLRPHELQHARPPCPSPTPT